MFNIFQKNLIITMIFIASLISLTSYAQGTIPKNIENKQFVKKVFANAIENLHANEEMYAKYFSKNYIQYTDGKTLNYSDFVAHLKAKKAAIKSEHVTFKYMVAEGDKVATIHEYDAIKKDGGRIKVEFHAMFQIKDNKIILCHELTRLIEGEKSDADIGSRH